jgi:hypothetical protein
MGSYPLSMFGQTSSFSSLFGGGASGASTNSQWIRSPLMATRRQRQRGGGKRKNQKKQKTQKQKGGFFSPSVMGPFLKNVEALAAPLSIYLGYKMYKSLKGKRNTQRA